MMSDPYQAGGVGNLPASRPTSDEITWAVVAHISVLVATVISVGTIGWVVPLILYFAYKEKSPFIRQASAGAFNFALMMFIVSAVAGILFVIGTFLGFLLVPLVFIVLACIVWGALYIASIVIPILATIAANKGEAYKYPLTLQVLR